MDTQLDLQVITSQRHLIVMSAPLPAPRAVHVPTGKQVFIEDVMTDDDGITKNVLIHTIDESLAFSWIAHQGGVGDVTRRSPWCWVPLSDISTISFPGMYEPRDIEVGAGPDGPTYIREYEPMDLATEVRAMQLDNAISGYIDDPLPGEL